jgi:hypothetical protein
MKRFFFFVLIWFGLVSYSLCQIPEFPILTSGTKIRISTTALIKFPNQRIEYNSVHTIIGTINSISQDTLFVKTSGYSLIYKEILILKSDISKIDTTQIMESRWESSKKSALIGGGIGGLIGMGIGLGATSDYHDDMQAGEVIGVTVIGAVIVGLPFALIGGIIGYNTPSEKWVTIYSSAPNNVL